MKRGIQHLRSALSSRQAWLPASLNAELSAMAFVASSAGESHSPIYKVFRTVTVEAEEADQGLQLHMRRRTWQQLADEHAPRRLIFDWERGVQSLARQLRKEAGCELDVAAMSEKVAASARATLARTAMDAGQELAITVALDQASVHVQSEIFCWEDANEGSYEGALSGRTIATTRYDTSAIMAKPVAPLDPSVGADPWRVRGWASPTVHPALSAEKDLLAGQEELLLLHQEEDGQDAVVVEGLNSNLAVLMADGSLAIRPKGCYLGQTVRDLLERLDGHSGGEGDDAVQPPLCQPSEAGATLKDLHHGRWQAAWLLCKFRGAKRLTQVIDPAGKAWRLDSNESNTQVSIAAVDQLLTSSVAASRCERAIDLRDLSAAT